VKFGETPLDEAEGAILVHGVRLAKSRLKKGRILTKDDVESLRAAGLDSVMAGRLEDGDVGEDQAAGELARAAAGDNLSLGTAATGRCNLYAEARGLAVFERHRLDACNLVDEALTIATIEPYAPVEPGDLVATVKVIPLAVPGAVLAACAALAGEPAPLLRVAAYRAKSAGLIQTRLPGTKERLLDKAVEGLSQRVAALGGALTRELRCDHDEAAVAAALGELADLDLVLVLGASATVDRRDVVPAAIERAGGAVEHLGMPVDPGNLTLLARLGGMPVIGLPGSARSPRIHGLDWLLRRIMAEITVGREDIMRMGAGGLLKEITQRPLPRAKASPRARREAQHDASNGAPRIAAVVLAAGQSRRMGSVNKLLSEIDGAPMVVRVAAAARASRAAPVVVVTGYRDEAVRAALADMDVGFVDNPDYAEGLSTSLAAGLAALPDDIDGAVVCLGDMPRVTAALIDRLIDAFDPAGGHAICLPTHLGKRGNPVLWAARFFAEIRAVEGDVGARHLIGEHAALVHEVECDDDGVLIDIDTPDALTALAKGF
jgi:molybdenum cofactor cytidylyltransferase